MPASPHRHLPEARPPRHARGAARICRECLLLTAANDGVPAYLAEACEQAGIAVIPCDSVQTFLHQAGGETGFGIVLDEALREGEVEKIEQWLAEEPGHREVPLVVLTSDAMLHDRLGRFRFATAVLPTQANEMELAHALRKTCETRYRQLVEHAELAELRRANRTLDQRHRELRQLALVLTRTGCAQRRATARSLEDDVQQLLAGARIRLHRLTDPTDRDDSRNAEIQSIDSVLQEAMQAASELANDLSPSLLHRGGLGPSLDELARKIAREGDVDVIVTWNDPADALPPDVRAVLYESVRELLSHDDRSGDGDIYVELITDDTRVRLSVMADSDGVAKDDGNAVFPSTEQELGLFAVRERLRLIGGRLHVVHVPDHGGCTTLEVPCDRDPDPRPD